MQSFNQNAIKHKPGLLSLAAELGNVYIACKMMGVALIATALFRMVLGYALGAYFLGLARPLSCPIAPGPDL